MPALTWEFMRMPDLGVQRLYDVLQLRCRVFILEQGPYLDPDGWDDKSWHLMGHAEPGGPLLAYLRIVDPGVRFDEPSIGRVITAPEVRGQGLGWQLMHEGLLRCSEVWPGRGNRISAQAHLQSFYGSLGYQPVGEPYGEDGIPHLEMLRPEQENTP